MATVDFALTTKEKVKSRIPELDENTDLDSMIEDMINECSAWIESFCERKFLETTYTNELYDGVGAGRNLKPSLLLKNFPVLVDSISSFQYQLSSTEWESFMVTSYVVDYASGIIRMTNGFLPAGWRNIRVTYTAGYKINFEDESEDHNLPYDIVQACTKLVIREMKRRQTIGVGQQTTGDNTVSYLDHVDKDILQTLEKYKKTEFI